MMLVVNSVYQNNDSKLRLRVIYLNYANEFCSYVDLDSICATPKTIDFKSFENKVADCLLTELDEPFSILLDETQCSKIEISKRDYAWNIIEKYWLSHREKLITKCTRTKVFQLIARQESLSEAKVRRIFSRFWQRGMVKNALLPDYANSGAAGKDRKLTVKNGKKRKFFIDRYALIVTDQVKIQFQSTINKYWRTPQQKSLKKVYLLLLSDFYTTKSVTGQIHTQYPIPSYNQFYYWFRKTQNKPLDIISRKGQNYFNLHERILLGNSTISVSGPGVEFQIDNTLLDVHLVSSLGRNRLIGRPLIYLVLDTFSRMITGFYITLETPSYLSAVLALDSMLEDKSQLCSRYGISISQQDWPCNHLPEAILADRGEMIAKKFNDLVNNFNIKIANTPPYRGDLKGVVERFNRTINDYIRQTLPGAIMSDHHRRGDPDYRLTAELTLNEITAIAIRVILLHNLKPIDKYQLPPEMINDNVPPCPLAIWNWGLQQQHGSLKIVNHHSFRLCLLPRKQAVYSRGVVIFMCLGYSSAELIKIMENTKKGSRRVELVYDPRNLSRVYALNVGCAGVIPLELTPAFQQFRDLSLEELKALNDRFVESRSIASQNILNYEIELEKKVTQIINDAHLQGNVADKNNNFKPKTQNLKGIPANRTAEKKIIRAKEMNVAAVAGYQTVAQLPVEEDNTKIYTQELFTKIRKITRN